MKPFKPKDVVVVNLSDNNLSKTSWGKHLHNQIGVVAKSTSECCIVRFNKDAAKKFADVSHGRWRDRATINNNFLKHVEADIKDINNLIDWINI